MVTLGNVHEVTVTKELTLTREFDWKISDFFSLYANPYDSPLFLFAGEYWYFRIYPNGLSMLGSLGYISVYLCRKNSDPPISITYSLGLKTSDGDKPSETKYIKSRTIIFNKNNTGFVGHKLLKRFELSENESELMPSGILTISCTIEYLEFTDDAGVSPTGECSYCERPFIAEDVSSREEKDLEVTCTRSVTEKILDDLGKILESKEHSDVIIKVKDKEFHLHRNILAGRNSYFHSMFNAEMKEKTSGTVSINDCEPSIFESFIHFLYTGKITALSNDNVCALYETTDKYQEDQLKSECLSYMKDKISVENFCDFIVLALRHNEKGLLQCATDLFCKKTLEIILRVEWQTFMREYPTQANELHIKALRLNAK